jgi:Zn-dependent protease
MMEGVPDDPPAVPPPAPPLGGFGPPDPPPGAPPPGWGYAPPPGAPPGWTPPPGAPPGWTPGPPPGTPPGAPPGWGYGPPPWTAPGGTTPTGHDRRLPVRPHPTFLALCAAFGLCGVLAAKEVGNPRVWVFGFVALGWVISLCLHEFAHAAVAWKGGDRGVEGRGYLTLNPARYMNSQMSIVLPILIVLIGGIALPGGAVIVDRRFVRQRHMRSLISAAGPLTNLTCALACGLPIAFGLVHVNLAALEATNGKVGAFPAALAFLALLEVIATILNLLPIPGFDGFGVIAPYLPDETVRSLMPIARYAWFGLFIILFWSAGGRAAFWSVSDHAASLIGVPIRLATDGQLLFTFWRKLS